MKRWPLSILGGFVIPFCYGLVLDQLNVLESKDTFSWLLRLPLAWPYYICLLFYNPAYNANEDFLIGFRGFEVYMLSIIIGNFIAYMLLTYALLSLWSKSEKLP